MPDIIDTLARSVRNKLGALKFSEPKLSVVRHVIETAYWASLKTEEGRFTRSSVTFANPRSPDPSPPALRRADYPSFTKLGRRTAFTVDEVAKLSRAIDKWSASIAVYGKSPKQVKVWGIVDQLVKQSIRHNREGRTGFSNPGLLTVSIDGIGDLSVHYGNIFLGAVRKQVLVTNQGDALNSDTMWNRVEAYFSPVASAIARHLPKSKGDKGWIQFLLLYAWSNTLARLCIGLKRTGTGGGFILTPRPKNQILSIGRVFEYSRMRDAMILEVLDQGHLNSIEEAHFDEADSGVVKSPVAWGLGLAQADAEDRESELAGAIKLVCSLATLDGVVLLSPLLKVRGFGTKIGPGPMPTTIFEADDFIKRGTVARKIDDSRFGTRHSSILRYCRADPHAIGVIVSQDGNVRIAAKIKGSMVLWDDVKLLDDTDYSPSVAKEDVKFRAQKLHSRKEKKLGYSRMPKTYEKLMGSRRGN